MNIKIMENLFPLWTLPKFNYVLNKSIILKKLPEWKEKASYQETRAGSHKVEIWHLI